MRSIKDPQWQKVEMATRYSRGQAPVELSDDDLLLIRGDVFEVLDLEAGTTAVARALAIAIRAGRVHGDRYYGECSCLIGTIARARSLNPGSLFQEPDRFAEMWFNPIRPGDTPATSVFSRLALQWVEEWIAAQSSGTGATA